MCTCHISRFNKVYIREQFVSLSVKLMGFLLYLNWFTNELFHQYNLAYYNHITDQHY